MIVLSLCTDSLIAFKGAFLTCMGLFFLSLLNIFFKDPRPFWTSPLIKDNSHCYFDFGSPDAELFILTFYYSYIVIMYRFKFSSENSSKFVSGLLVFLLVACIGGAYFSGIANGVTYLHQSLTSQLFGFCYLVICLTFDREIHGLCEKSGFVLKSSRSKKFKLFFICLAMWVTLTIYYMACVTNYTVPQDWVLNIIAPGDECATRVREDYNFVLGLDASYQMSAMIFYVIGMVFGQSYNLNYVKPLNWVHTHWTKRAVRAIIGAFVAVGLYAFFYFLMRNNRDQSTVYFFRYALPAFVISFIMYGFFPVVCKKIGLVATHTPAIQISRSRSTTSRSKSTNDIHTFLQTSPGALRRSP
jgi:hypothetical protein